MHIDVKVTMWQRIQLNENEGVSLEEVIELLEKFGPSELWNDEKERFLPDYENMTDTEEYISVEENQGCSTMELYNDNGDLLWENSNKKE